MDKQYACSSPNCKMSFSSEDNLQVHQRCHEIQFALNDQDICHVNHQYPKNITFTVDQTPTPTLFQEINLNPFDFEFRKASQFKTQLSVSDNVSDSLETPRILPLVDSDETITSTSRDYPATHYGTHYSLSQRNVDISVIDVEEDHQRNEKERKKLTLNVTSLSTESSQSPSVISTPTPVITAGPSVSHALFSCNTPNILLDSANNSPAISLASGTDSSLHSLSPTLQFPPVLNPIASQYDPVQVSAVAMTHTHSQPVVTQSASVNVPSSPATVLQLVLRLPNGQSIPVEIPATPVVSTSSLNSGGGVVNIAPATQTSSVQTYVQSSGLLPNIGSSLAKMKLKQALASSSTAARPGPTRHSRANTADRIAEMTRNRNMSGGSIVAELNDDSSNSSSFGGQCVASASNLPTAKRQRRSSSPDDDPAQKRRKFLERNRVAAVRCREKKKHVVQTLFARSDELENNNTKLQTEVSLLRSEVAVLKTLLLQHKDCPVTLAMQAGDVSMVADHSASIVKLQQTNGVITEILRSPPMESPQRNVAHAHTAIGSGAQLASGTSGTILVLNGNGTMEPRCLGPPIKRVKRLEALRTPRFRSRSLPSLTNSTTVPITTAPLYTISEVIQGEQAHGSFQDPL